MPFARWLTVALTVFAGLAAGGCGSDHKVAVVSGNVTYDGKPIEKGQISFFPLDGKGVTTGGAIVDGAYKAEVSLGEMKVTINATKSKGKRKLYANDPKSPEIDLLVEALPEKYHDKSDLKLDVKERIVKKDFDLKK